MATEASGFGTNLSLGLFMGNGYFLRLVDRLNHYFDPLICRRGEQYFHEHHVKLNELDDKHAIFSVSGTRIYNVQLLNWQNEEEIGFECTCPYFQETDLCKHVWASILFLDQHLERKSPSNNKPGESLTWREKLESARHRVAQEQRIRGYSSEREPEKRKSVSKIGTYAIDLSQSVTDGRIYLEIFSQDRLKKGGLGVLKPAELSHDKIEFYEDPAEKDFLWDLLGRTEKASSYYNYLANRVNSLYLSSGHADGILQKISQANKLFLIKSTQNRFYGAYDRPEIIAYSYHSEVWNFFLKMERIDSGYEVSGYVKNEFEEMKPVSQVVAILDNFIFLSEFCTRSDLSNHKVWYELIRSKPLVIEDTDLDAFMQMYISSEGNKVPLSLPSEIQFTDIIISAPRTRISFIAEKNSGRLQARIHFIYDESEVAPNTGAAIYDFNQRTKINRHLSFESEQLAQFLKFEPEVSDDSTVQGYFSDRDFVAVAEKCIAMGWEVLAQGQNVKIGQGFDIRSKSEMDWFDLQIDFQFASETVGLPQLLLALRSGQRMVKLGDGSTGLLPKEWLTRFSPLLEIGKSIDGGVRLSKVQALFYSATLPGDEKFTGEKKFGSLQKILRDLTRLKLTDEDKKFKGTLRHYQKEGLSWLKLISEHQIGGILADDMGLGKTIQILSLLSQAKKNSKPTLIIAPKSLIFNWENEAKKFTPDLKITAYVGNSRHLQKKNLSNVDLIVTTYHTMRNDIETFKAIDFDFLILDEAHSIKNPQSQVNQAARLLKADKKIALTGTPIENSLMDLFSILSVVTPGLVSEAQAQRWVKENDSEKIQLLAKALSPFVLRRTKDQVLKDLPEKSEQILYCELSTVERKKYEDLKNFYWGQLSGKIADVGLGKSKIQVLEALLRLRQASCHLGLLDEKQKHSGSSKFETVLEQIDILIQDGHRALVFSQFTSLLELFANELKRKKIAYQYLDGQTRDRAERVQNFQENTEIPIFLLSLKAGGVGLNLTAADFVFILDPWWNPAAESQAIDRTHRIGQTKKVLAYKVIAKDTIEEKILLLQEKKRNLAKAVISNDSSLLKSLKMEDLRELFS